MKDGSEITAIWEFIQQILVRFFNTFNFVFMSTNKGGIYKNKLRSERGNVNSETSLKVIVLGEITSQLQYLKCYGSILFMSFPPTCPLFTTPVKLLVKLTSAILTFRPSAILIYPSFPFGLISTIVAKFFNKVHVSSVYGNDVMKRTRMGKIMVSLTLKLSNGVICDSDNISELVKLLGGLNIITIPMGIDTSGKFNIQQRRQSNTIVSVLNFNLAYEKGIDLLINALKVIPRVNLVLIGDGSQKNVMISLVKKLKLDDRVTFTGFIPREELWLQLTQASLFILPTRSTFIEGTNRSLLEAMYCNLPVVVTRTGGSPEIVRNGVNGLLVEPGNLDDLVKSIKILLADPELRGN